MEDTQALIQATETFVRQAAVGAEAGHDFWHAFRVRAHALAIHETSGGDRLLIELTALLHDVADHKFHGGDTSIGPRTAAEFLRSAGASEILVNSVASAIGALGYEGPAGRAPELSLEQAIVRDADRLDALGAIGVARAFSFGGHCRRPMFDPELLPELDMTREQYRNSAAPSINHFFEKLLLLKDRMLTPGGQRLARQRHTVLAAFTRQFLEECFACMPHAAWQEWLAQNGARFEGIDLP